MHLYFVSGCCDAAMAELYSSERDLMVRKPEIFSLALLRTKLANSSLRVPLLQLIILHVKMPLFKLLCGFRLLIGPYWYVYYIPVPPLAITTHRIGTVSIWERSSYYFTQDQ